MTSEIIVAIIGAAAIITNVILTNVLHERSARKRENSEDDQLIHEALKCLLRATLIQEYDLYISKGYCEVHEKVSIDEQYKVYHALGGNGTITAIYEKLMELPTEPHTDSDDDCAHGQEHFHEQVTMIK